MTPRSLLTCVSAAAFFSGLARAADISSNGTGGGAWSAPATWRGGAVPRSGDEVTVRKGDAVVFDRNDDAGTTCARLFIDPQGALRFKTGAGKVVLVVSGPVECFGLIKLDGSASADDLHELRLTGKTPDERAVKCDKGGLIASGKAKLPAGRHNVRIVARGPDLKATDPTATVEVKNGALDVQQADLENIKLSGNDIDNTGSRPGERCNVVGNHFQGRCNIILVGCDTPAIADNLLHYPGDPWHQPAAITLNGCPLAEVKNNTVKGYFYYAFSIYGCTDAVVAGNTTEKAYVGAYCVGTTAFKGNTFREAGQGFVLTSMTGVIEECVFDQCTWGVGLAGATIQMSNCIFRNPPKAGGHVIDLSAGEVTLINCNFGPEEVILPKMLPKAEKPLVTAMYFLVLGAKGTVPQDAQVEVTTAGGKAPAPGVADLNVRNSPAPLLSHRTPLPESLSPLIVKAWVIDKDGKLVPSPVYAIRVLAPAAEGKERKVLATLTVKPDGKWYRPKPNDPAATLELEMKKN